MIERRAFLTGLGFAAVGLGACGGRADAGAVPAAPTPAITRAIAAIEARVGGRLGVAVIDLQTGRRVAHRGDERFPMCSTFKYLLAGQVLARVDRGEEDLERAVPITRADMLSWSPASEKRVGGTMTVKELCAAAVSYSDNAAANLLLKASGGPSALTAFARTLGDEVTRLDRYELALNSAIPDDPRDTTSPNAMLVSVGALTLGGALSAPSRALATSWLVGNTTGKRRLRAGLPADWKVGDKTGTGTRGTANDVAVAWPPSGGPLLIASYLTGATGDSAACDQAHADVGRAVAKAWPKLA